MIMFIGWSTFYPLDNVYYFEQLGPGYKETNYAFIVDSSDINTKINSQNN